MKKIRVMLSFLFVLLLWNVVEAKEHPLISEETMMDMSKTYSFCQAQDYSLIQIQKLFPEYKKQAIEAKLKFNVKFGASVTLIDESLSGLGDSWEKIKNETMNKMKSLSDFSKLSDSEVEKFIEEVNKRTTGNIQSPILETLLIFNPTYITNPALEFENGFTKKFTSEGHLKNKDIHFTLRYPASWKANEAERPNIIQKFSSENGRGLETLMILIKKLPIEPSYKIYKVEVEEIFQKSNILEMLPNEIVITEYSRATIDSLPGAMVEYEEVRSRLTHNFFTKNLIFLTFCKNSLLMFHFAETDLVENKNDVLERYLLMKPLFILMANSIVIHDNWKTQYANLEYGKNENDTNTFVDLLVEGETGLFIAYILLSFILTWGIGLLPPILIRFVFIRKPLSKTWAIVLVVLFLFINLAVFLALGSENKTHTALLLVAWISYYILRKQKKVKDGGKDK